jgi:hypothetical protein
MTSIARSADIGKTLSDGLTRARIGYDQHAELIDARRC